MVEWVERFHGEYYPRPGGRLANVRKAMFDAGDRKRLYGKAKAILSLRAKAEVRQDSGAGRLDRARKNMSDSACSGNVRAPPGHASEAMAAGPRRSKNRIQRDRHPSTEERLRWKTRFFLSNM